MKQLFTAILLVVLGTAYSQELFYLEEDFETFETRSRWTQSPTGQSFEWEFTDKGQDGGFYPASNFQGDVIAGLWRPDLVLHTMKLISPTVELDGSKKPTLRFAHTQWSDDGPDYLRLYFRAGPNSSWDLIEEWTTQIDYWKDDEIYDIADIDEKYLTDTFQVAFEGEVGNGRGVYIDSVTIKEEEVVEKYVKRSTFRSVKHTVVPGGGTDIPMEQVMIRVLGNTGTSVLNTITVEKEGTGKDHLVPTSFKLWQTSGEVFTTKQADTSTYVAAGTQVGNQISFTGLGIELDLGNNYFWVTANVTDTLKGSNSLRFKVPATGINVSDSTFPGGETYFSRTHLLQESVLYDNFESGMGGWTAPSGLFEVGEPTGIQVNTQKNPDAPYNGSNILATNLSGGYPTNISAGSEIYAYSPEVDLTYYIEPKIYFQSWIAINNADIGVIEYSIDGGTAWNRIWTSDLSLNNSTWTEYIDETLQTIAARQPRFQVRFGLIKTYTTPWPGFSIDNFAVVAEKLYKDIGVSQIDSPVDDCIDCGDNTVKAWFRNYAQEASPSVIPVFYGLNGIDGTLVRDTIYGSIAKDDSVLFSFTVPADFPKADFYDNFIVGVDLAGDQDPVNDTLVRKLVIQKNITPPFTEDFEFKGGVWLTQDTATWAYADMTGTIDPIDPATPHIWVLAQDGDYWGNDKSWVTSGCYNLKDETRNIVEFSYWSDLEYEKDGVRIEYTRDDGATWKTLTDPTYRSVWNWMPDTVETLGSGGWTGPSSGWLSSKALLPVDIDTALKAKFRVFFMSDAANTTPQGFAFDDFKVYHAPIDVGVQSIIDPIDACQNVNDGTVTVRVQNYGYNKLSATDTIIVGVNIEGETPFYDTIQLASDLLPGATQDLLVNSEFDFTEAKTYNLEAYTLIEDDPWFYGANNDSAAKSFTVWENPIIELADTIGSRQPDTVVVNPNYVNWVPGYTYLWEPGSVTTPDYDVLGNGYPEGGVFKITATEPVHSCFTVDSVNVLLLYSDAGIDSLISPLTGCTFDVDEIIRVSVKNMGTDSIFSSISEGISEIEVGYKIVGEPGVYTETIQIAEGDPLRSGETFVHEFTGYPFDFSAIRSYTIKTWAVYAGGDKDHSNDTLTYVLTNYGFTPLNLGGDQVITSLTHTLDAGAGFDTYAWTINDGADTLALTQTLDLDASLSDASDEYEIYAVDGNGCASKDSVDVWFKIRDVMVQKLTTPANSCRNDIADETYVRVNIINNGSDTITTSDNIVYSYIVDGGATVTETASPTYDIVPYAQYTHDFTVAEDFTTVKDYTFEITASAEGDLRTHNDSLADTITVHANPVVDLGEYPDPVTGLSLELDAGTGPYDYLWQDNLTTSRTYIATATANYSVTVTDTVTGCSDSDTTFVQFDQLDYEVTAIDGLGSRICQFEKTELSVDVSNEGNLPRVDASFTIGYVIGSSTPHEEVVTVEGSWAPGLVNAQTFTFSKDLEFLEDGQNDLKVYVYHSADLIRSNDTLIESLSIDESPLVDFGGDTIQVAVGGRLDAGEHATYQWQDNFDGRYYTITSTSPDYYSVTVTDVGNSCITTRGVFVEPTSGIWDTKAENLDFMLYPNPASDVITIKAQDISGDELFVEIYSISNQLLWSDYHDGFGEYENKLDVSGYKPGVYLLRFRNNSINHTQRFIVQ